MQSLAFIGMIVVGYVLYQWGSFVLTIFVFIILIAAFYEIYKKSYFPEYNKFIDLLFLKRHLYYRVVVCGFFLWFIIITAIDVQSQKREYVEEETCSSIEKSIKYYEELIEEDKKEYTLIKMRLNEDVGKGLWRKIQSISDKQSKISSLKTKAQKLDCSGYSKVEIFTPELKNAEPDKIVDKIPNDELKIDPAEAAEVKKQHIKEEWDRYNKMSTEQQGSWACSLELRAGVKGLAGDPSCK